MHEASHLNINDEKQSHVRGRDAFTTTVTRSRDDQDPIADVNARASKRQRTGHEQLPQDIVDVVLDKLRKIHEDDQILLCGSAALDLLDTNVDAVLELAQEKLHTWPYRDVPMSWRRLFEDASLYKAVNLLQCPDHSALPLLIRTLDMGIALSGQPHRKALFRRIFDHLDNTVSQEQLSPETFDVQQPAGLHTAGSVPRSKAPDFEVFQRHLNGGNTPLVVEDLIGAWPALTLWQKPAYLLAKTLNGQRLVPVEIGGSYTEDDWTQTQMTFKQYLDEFVLARDNHRKGYLAQHDLLSQVPALLADIQTPDYCWTSPPPAPDNIPLRPAQLDEPQMNAWFGPEGTKSPLHTDPYYNILCQIVGYKYVRLYAPAESSKLYPRSTNEAGINMANTSHLDLAYGRCAFDAWPLAVDAAYQEVILSPGECLYIPAGWWHFIESLSISFSVSFWWN